MTTITIEPAEKGIVGEIRLPGDKSLSHRALLFGALRGNVRVIDVAPGDDVARTIAMLDALGYPIEREEATLIVHRRGDRSEEGNHIDCGNSGTTARLGLGFLVGEHGEFTVTGDDSLRSRPMARIIDPLRTLGAEVMAPTDRLPVTVIADGVIEGSDAAIEVGTAQVHAGLVLAGLRSRAGCRLHRTAPMRDHTLRLLHHFGWMEEQESREYDLILPGLLTAADPPPPLGLRIPGDFSSAAFLIAAAILIPGSDLTLRNVGLNPTRTAFLDAVERLGADVEWSVDREEWEPAGTIRARHTPLLTGSPFTPERIDVALMMDELPILSLLCAVADGESVISGASELRVKETDRIAGTASILRGVGARVDELPDGLRFAGGSSLRGGASLDPLGDHRLAMLAGVAGRASSAAVTIVGPECVDVSWPDFWSIL